MKSQTLESQTVSNFSHVRTGTLPFSVYWVSSSDEQNADILNSRNHHHTYYELHVVTDGFVEYTVGERSFPMEKGDFLWLPSGCVHRVDGWGTAFTKATIAWDPRQPIPFDDDLLRPHKMSPDMVAEAERLFINASSKSAYRSQLTSLAVSGLILRAAELLGLSMTDPQEEERDDRVLKAKLLYIQ